MYNKPLEAATVKVNLASDADSAWRDVAPNGPGTIKTQVAPLPGSYSGRVIGDHCLRGGMETNTAGDLWFSRGIVGLEVGIYGRPGQRNFAAAAEALALALVQRVDAVTVLGCERDDGRMLEENSSPEGRRPVWLWHASATSRLRSEAPGRPIPLRERSP